MFEIERTRLDRWRGWASWRQAVYRQISGNPSVFSALGASLSGLRQSAREIQIFIYESQFSVENLNFYPDSELLTENVKISVNRTSMTALVSFANCCWFCFVLVVIFLHLFETHTLTTLFCLHFYPTCQKQGWRTVPWQRSWLLSNLATEAKY